MYIKYIRNVGEGKCTGKHEICPALIAVKYKRCMAGAVRNYTFWIDLDQCSQGEKNVLEEAEGAYIRILVTLVFAIVSMVR